MIMPLKSTESGLIKHELSPGSIISAGDLLASLALKDPSKVQQHCCYDVSCTMILSPSITHTCALLALVHTYSCGSHCAALFIASCL
jgi:hypothetical protein